ncbi:MAG: hypothetical protein L0Y80_06535 [Ignavibacteriae bacterium]|nr:hypothetical protein [Ignavibacteriota bacterium]
MGHQQLLLFVLVAIVVGLAAYGVNKTVDVYNQSNDEDILYQQMDAVIIEGKKYAAKLKTQGGGEGSMTGFKAPSKMLNNGQTRLNIFTFGQWMIIQGYGSVKGKNGTTPVYIIGLYDTYEQEWRIRIRVN